MNLAILQARMSSSRLPGKVMADVLGQPMIGRQLERLDRCARLDAIVVATSTDPSDDPLCAWLEGQGRRVCRGSLGDVLDRFHAALAQVPEATTVVRLTADCPLADPQVIDATVGHHLATGADYTSNTPSVRTYPHGLDTEVMTRAALERAWREGREPYEREHVTPYIYRHPELFRIESISREPSLAHLRWTVDLPEDLDFVRGVYAALYPVNPAFGSDDIVRLTPNSSGARP